LLLIVTFVCVCYTLPVTPRLITLRCYCRYDVAIYLRSSTLFDLPLRSFVGCVVVTVRCVVRCWPFGRCPLRLPARLRSLICCCRLRYRCYIPYVHYVAGYPFELPLLPFDPVRCYVCCLHCTHVTCLLCHRYRCFVPFIQHVDSLCSGCYRFAFAVYVHVVTTFDRLVYDCVCCCVPVVVRCCVVGCNVTPYGYVVTRNTL